MCECGWVLVMRGAVSNIRSTSCGVRKGQWEGTHLLPAAPLCFLLPEEGQNGT